VSGNRRKESRKRGALVTDEEESDDDSSDAANGRDDEGPAGAVAGAKRGEGLSAGNGSDLWVKGSALGNGRKEEKTDLADGGAETVAGSTDRGGIAVEGWEGQRHFEAESVRTEEDEERARMEEGEERGETHLSALVNPIVLPGPRLPNSPSYEVRRCQHRSRREEKRTYRLHQTVENDKEGNDADYCGKDGATSELFCARDRGRELRYAQKGVEREREGAKGKRRTNVGCTRNRRRDQ
jgi:hypothetical protein